MIVVVMCQRNVSDEVYIVGTACDSGDKVGQVMVTQVLVTYLKYNKSDY